MCSDRDIENFASRIVLYDLVFMGESCFPRQNSLHQMEVYKDGVMGWDKNVRNGTESSKMFGHPIMTTTPVDTGHLRRMCWQRELRNWCSKTDELVLFAGVLCKILNFTLEQGTTA